MPSQGQIRRREVFLLTKSPAQERLLFRTSGWKRLEVEEHWSSASHRKINRHRSITDSLKEHVDFLGDSSGISHVRCRRGGSQQTSE